MKYFEIDESGALIDLTDKIDSNSTLTDLISQGKVDEDEHYSDVYLGFSTVTGQIERVVVEDDSKSLDEVWDIIGQAMRDRATDMEDVDD